MADDVKQLLVQIDASVELLRRNLRSGEQQVAQFERQVVARTTTIERTFGKLGAGIDPVIAKFNTLRAAAASVGVGVTVGAFTAAAKEAFSFAAGLAEAAARVGTTVEQYQILSRAALESGASQELLDTALARLNKTLGDAKRGSEKAIAAFAALGISREQIASYRQAGDALPAVMEGLKRAGSAAEQASKGAGVFGKSVAGLLPMMTQGAAGFEQWRQAALKAGLITQEQAEKADELEDRLALLGVTIKTNLAVSLLDIISRFERVGEVIGRVQGRVDDFINRIRAITPDNLEGLLFGDLLDQLQGGNIGRGSVSIDLPRPRQPRPPALDLGEPDGDLSSDSSGRRTQQQAYEAFRRELLREGITPTSGFRTTAQQAELFRRLGPGNAAPPGTSDHEAHRAFDLPAHADPAKIAAAAARAGVTLGRPLVHGGPGNLHRHQPFSDGASGGGGEAELARQAEEEGRRRREQADRDFRIRQEIAEAHVAELEALREAAPDYAEQGVLALQIAEARQRIYEAAQDHRVQMGEIGAAQAEELKAAFARAGSTRRAQILAERAARTDEEAERIAQRDADARLALLQLQAELATTADERRRVELEILRLANEEKRRRLQAIVASDSASTEEAETARRELLDIDRTEPLERERIRRATRSPLEEMLERIPDSAGEVNEALERIAADGLQSLEDGITEAIVSGRSLGEVFRRIADQIIADLVRIAVQQAIIRPLAGLLGGAIGGGIGGGIGEGGALPGLFGGGNMLLAGFASGGSFVVGGNGGTDRNLLSINGVPAARVGRGEMVSVLPRVPRAPKLTRAAERSVSIAMPITLHAPGADPAQLARLRAEFEQARAELPARVVEAVRDGRVRNML